MEKVEVVKAVPGILKIGDVLVSTESGADFCLEETEVTKHGSSERFISLDYITVCENVPQFFEFVGPDEDFCEEECPESDVEISSDIVRADYEIGERNEFFQKQFSNSLPGSEAQVVYKNLIWFIDWLYGRKEVR